MKPTAQQVEHYSGSNRPSRREFPLVDFNYQTFSFERFGGGDQRPRSFFDISRGYFQHEAGRNFLAEVAFFLVLAAILAGAFIEGALVIIHFLHLPPA